MELVFEHFSDYRNFYINNLRNKQEKQLREFEQQLEKTWREKHQQKNFFTIDDIKRYFADGKGEIIVNANIKHDNIVIVAPSRVNITNEGIIEISPIQPDSK